MKYNEKDRIRWYSWESLDPLGIQAGTTCRKRTGGEDFNLALHVPSAEKEVLQNRRDLCTLLNLEENAFTSENRYTAATAGS